MHSLLRLIDANANRAREGLRVLEDLARFVLDRGDLSEAAKRARHEVTASSEAMHIDPVHLLAARDTVHDVGTSIGTSTEYSRANLRDLALSAAGRCTEALRCLEEGAKALGHAPEAKRLESTRYNVYTLEKELILSLPSGTAPQWRLCVLVSESLCAHHPWEAVVQASILGGADCIQLREKSLDDAELLRRATRLVTLCHAATPRVAAIINDRPDIALAAGADGVHLGQTDLPIRAARELLGSKAWIGVSTTNLDEAHAAHRAGADSIGLGPMFATTTKHKDSIAGPAYIRAVLVDEHLRSIPHLAIGGVTPERVAELRAAGVRGVAVSSVVCGAADPSGVCRALLHALLPK